MKQKTHTPLSFLYTKITNASNNKLLNDFSVERLNYCDFYTDEKRKVQRKERET